jgi:phospholipase C
MALLASDTDGFTGNNPLPGSGIGPGWGCDSFEDAQWVDPSTGETLVVPSCVPDAEGNGPYRTSPVPYERTILDEMDEHGISWRLYAANGPADTTSASGYEWTACPTFYECFGGPQKANWVPAAQIIGDAGGRSLPQVSLIIPARPNSQHNQLSMLTGDNWIGDVVSAVENGPAWSSTAIFITYDDCGCFYDHARPPAGYGIRMPMVIVSPFARSGYTDSRVASTNSILAYIEHTFGLAPLSNTDRKAYDYADSFDYQQAPLPPAAMVRSAIPKWEQRWLAAHPNVAANDPT